MGADRPDHTETEDCIHVFEPGFFVVGLWMANGVSNEVLKVVTNVSHYLNGVAGELLLMSEGFKTRKSLLKQLVEKIIQQINCFLR